MTWLASVPARRIIGAVADAAARWSDADFPPRVRLLDRIVERTGYTLPVVEYALDQLFFSLSHDALAETIADELGSIDALDRFVERRGRPPAMALPIGSVCVISSRTTIGVAIVPAVCALLAKCDVLVKDREDGLVRAFFATLVEELDAFAGAASAESWRGDDGFDASAFDAVVAFGSDETLETIGKTLLARSRYLPFGSKASIGYVGREALADERAARIVADGAARDLVLYESEGCLSLHALFVERGAAIAHDAFAALLADAVQRAAVEFPPGERDARARAELANARNLAAFRAATGKGAVFSDPSASFLIVTDPPVDEPPPFLPRALAVRSVEAPDEAASYLEAHKIPLEALAATSARDDVSELARRLGANRIAAFGELQRPRFGGNHGGRPRIAEFVRWMTLET